MAYLYIYSPSDFVGGLPDEAGAAADGAPVFTLTLVAGATPTLIEVTDDDLIFDEVDATQELTDAVTIDGTAYAAGTTINTAYDLINSTTGAKVTSFHFGGDGYQQGPVDGIASSEPLLAGQSYTFNTERTSHQQANAYDDYIACFVSDTRITTQDAQTPVQDLKAGDPILTADHGLQPLRLMLSRTLGAQDLARHPQFRPVRIVAGALGQGLPSVDLLVSPQHRMLAVSPVARRMFGQEETLISAKKLTALPGIYVDETATEVTYYHLVMDQHEIIFAENTPTESFFCGPMAMRSLSNEARGEVFALFPALAETAHEPAFARPVAAPKQQSRLVSRHGRNAKPLLS